MRTTEGIISALFFVFAFALFVIFSSTSSASTSPQLNDIGNAFTDSHRYQEALEAYNKALELDPNNANAWRGKGLALKNLERFQEAIDALNKATELDPDYLDAWIHKGWALDSSGKKQEAVVVFQIVINISDRLITLAPDRAHTWSTKGKVLFELGSYQESIDSYDRAIQIKSDEAYFWRDKGNVLKALGKLHEANQAYDKAFELISKPVSNQDSSSVEQDSIKAIPAINIKRGYSVLSNNDIKFGIRLENETGFTITDIDTILDYNEDLFEIKDSKIQRIGNIAPEGVRTITYILKPLACIHNEQINALITYKDHTGKKQTLHMRPKEVHCVCPFLKEMPMSEGEYSRLAASSEFVQEGISFKGITIEELAKFMGETCRHMLYKVREYDLEGKRVVYLSGESLGEKAYYLLTAVIQEYKGLTQVLLRAHSDKKYGLNGFMNEMADSIRNLIGSVQNAKEIGIIENTQVINIIDSIVQRTSFTMGENGSTQVNIKDSVVQRSTIGKNKP